MITRFWQPKLKSMIKPGKVLVIYGPRRAGKTTLINAYLNTIPTARAYIGNGENADLRQFLESQSFSQMIPYFSGYDLVVIDEAQKVRQIGASLKILVDQIPNIKLVVTGSSAFDLASMVGEPLLGRQNTIKLYPFWTGELSSHFGQIYVKENLNNLLVYGNYPEVINPSTTKQKEQYLYQIRDGYLFKDILELDGIKNSAKILDLLRLVAFQIGKEVSLQELGLTLGISKNTVERYLDLLEKSFVLIKVRGLAKNLRKEISKMARYYFVDNGVRNSVISNFNPIANRDDLGQLWENFLFAERAKRLDYHQIVVNRYFWRTWDRQEIDLIEEVSGQLSAFEFKWGDKAIAPPKAWIEAYPGASFQVVNQEIFGQFVL